MTLAYCPATESDVLAIFEQAKILIDTYEDTAAIEYDNVLAWVKRKIDSCISSYTRVTLAGETCAYYRLCDDGELDDLYVLPDFRNQGIGSEILSKCAQESKQPLWLYVFSCNTGAISFYKRFGFSVRETIGTTRLIMARNG